MINAKEVAASKQVARMDEARYLAMVWAQVVEAETRANLLEVELISTLEGQRRAGVTDRRPPKCKSKSSVTRRVRSSFRVADKACLQGYYFSFDVCEFIM